MARTIGGSSNNPSSSSRSASASLLLGSSSSRTPYLVGIIPGSGHNHHGGSSSATNNQGPFSLPLLEGLSHRNRSAAVAVVEEAFQQWHATKVLSKAFDDCHGKKIQRPRPTTTTTSPRRKRRGKTSPVKPPRTAATKNSGSAEAIAGTASSIDRSHDKENQPHQRKQQYYHWLFQGLQSSSLPERRVACKILAQGLRVSGDPNFIWQVLELVVDLLKFDHANTALISLLKHLLTEVVDAKTQLAFSINQSMGIPWLCQLIYSIVSSTTSSSASGNGSSMISNKHTGVGDDEDNSVLMPLLDLLYHLVMIDRSSKYLHQAHLVLWNKKQQQQSSSLEDNTARNNSSSSSSSPSKTLFEDVDPHNRSLKPLVLSPLGCLIAAKHYVSDHHHNKTILSLLLPLVDPESIPKLLPPKLAETSKDDCYLIDTFKDTTTQAGSGGTNKSSAEGTGAQASASTAAGAASSLAELRAAVGSVGGDASSTDNAAAGSTTSPSAAAAAQAAAASLESALPGAASTVAQLFSAVYSGGGGSGSGASGSSPGGGAASDDHHHLLEDHEMEDADDDHHFDDVEDEHHHDHDEDEDEDDDEDQNHDDEDHDDDEEVEQHDHHDDEVDDDEDGQHQDADEDMDEDGDNNTKNKSNNAGRNSSDPMDVDEDEEIDSEDGDDVEVKDHDDDEDDDEDDDDDDDDDDEEDDEEDEDHSGIVIHDEDVARLEQGLLELNELDAVRGATGGNSSSVATSAAAAAIAARLGQNPGSLSALASGAASSLAAGLSGVTDPASEHPRTVQERKEIYIRACMQVINAQHPLGVKHPSSPPSPQPFKTAAKRASSSASTVSAASPPPSMLSLKAEHALMTSILNIVQPPKKPVNLKFILRRAPTQEEFFRGSLSKNPVTLSMLKSSQGQEEPTVRDLRQHIATDLQMADSAEMLELLVTNKILDVDLKLRVVHQVTWKDHLIQNAPPSGSAAANAASSALSSFLGGRGGGGARSFISTGSGLSMIFNSGLDRSIIAAGGGPISADTPLSALPPMIVTYRLTGVDGEATEDTITTLQDPEAPSETASPEQVEEMMEKKFGITRLVTGGRGASILLRSVDRHVSDILRRIRRDSIGKGGGHNPSRDQFKAASPCSALSLLMCCSKLPSNRKLLLETRAPTILLRLLLDVLHSLEEQQEFGGSKKSESNATAQSLQELIEVLASDMLSSSTQETPATAVVASPSSPAAAEENDTEQDTSTLRLLIQGIETSSLSRPLRNVIAKLLPYLTYGQAPLAKELALEFVRHVQVDRLGDCENEDDLLEQVTGGRRYILMATFVHASISLRPNEVCNSLRTELIACGFVQGIANFLLRGVPTEPPTWTASLWLKGEQPNFNVNSKRKEQLEREWREYTQRHGLKIAFDILIGLSKQHGPTHEALGKYVASNKVSLIRACHWLEATSDNTSARVSLNGLGLVAETLLDELATDESPVVSQVKACRRKTRDRKKEIAMERRSKALVSMSSFGPLAGATTLGEVGNKSSSSSLAAAAASGTTGGSVRSTMASIVAPVWDLFQGSSSSQPGNSNDSSTSPPPSKRRKRNQQSPAALAAKKPAWMAEMENMEDETGRTCCVCQEGRTLQPSEILGLYAYVKKITVPLSQGGGRSNIDGTTLLVSLPSTVPGSIAGTHAGNTWFPAAMGARNDLSNSSRSSMSSSVAGRRATYFTTTVSAGNAIHFSCHTKARQADRNHPKAPKSEWEGASLRNSRVQCNVILPLVSSRSSKVPLVAVDVALTDHQTAVSNLLGARPKSMLWTVLHDVRFLLLRMAYGEALNADCGGGSLLSNAQLVYYQLLMADMFEKDAQLDAPDTSQHARGLSAGFLAACAIIKANGGGTATSENNAMLRGIADAAPMACLTGVLFFNNKDDYSRSSTSKTSSSSSSEDNEEANPKRRWVVGRENFLRGLLNCTGRRHALGVTNSGCLTGRTSGNKRSRSGSAFADWDIVDEEDILMDIGGSGSTTSSLSPERATLKRSTTSSNKVGIDDFRDALRPMIVYFAMMDQISTDFVLNMDDTKVEENSANLVQVIEDCRRCKNIKDLLNKAKVTLGEDEIIDELQKGMMSA